MGLSQRRVRLSMVGVEQASHMCGHSTEPAGAQGLIGHVLSHTGLGFWVTCVEPGDGLNPCGGSLTI